MRPKITFCLSLLLSTLSFVVYASSVETLFEKASQQAPPLRFRITTQGHQSNCSGTFIEKTRETNSCRYSVLTSAACVGETENSQIRLESPFSLQTEARSVTAFDTSVLTFTGECRDVDVFKMTEVDPATNGLLCFSQVEHTEEGTSGGFRSAPRSKVLTSVGNLSGTTAGNFRWNSIQPERPARLWNSDMGTGVFCDVGGEIRVAGVIQEPSTYTVTGGGKLAGFTRKTERADATLGKAEYHAISRGPAILGHETTRSIHR